MWANQLMRLYGKLYDKTCGKIREAPNAVDNDVVSVGEGILTRGIDRDSRSSRQKAIFLRKAQ